MNQQQITETPQKKRVAEETPGLLNRTPATPVSLQQADEIALQIAAELLGARQAHAVVDAVDDERLYNENQQTGGQ